MTLDHNVNSADCIRTAAHFGETVVYNICSGKVTTIPWGSVDWALALGLSAFAAVIGIVFLAMAVAIIRD
jgi:hypothetical protein